MWTTELKPEGKFRAGARLCTLTRSGLRVCAAASNYLSTPLLYYTLPPVSAVCPQTFFDLRDKLTSENIDVRSMKIHHSELATYKDKVYDSVSFENESKLPCYSYYFSQGNFEGVRIFVILSYESFALPMLCEVWNTAFAVEG